MDKNIENKNPDIVLTCIEEKLIKDEFVFKNHSLVRIISGIVKVVQVDRSFEFGSGDTFLIPRNQLAAFYKYPKDGKFCKTILITLTKKSLQSFYSTDDFEATQNPPKGIRVFEKHPLLESLFASIKPYFELNDKLPEKMVSLKIEETITVLRSLDNEIDNILTDFSNIEKVSLDDFMEKNYLFNISLEKFAYLTGRSLPTFKRDFKKLYQTTPQRWITQKRLDYAYHQIANKSRKPIDIYLESGFENLSHFSYVLKKRFGYSPSNIPQK